MKNLTAFPYPVRTHTGITLAQALLQAAQYRLEHVSRKELKMWGTPDMTAPRFQRAVQLLIERHLVVLKKDGRGIYLAAAPCSCEGHISLSPQLPH